MIKTKRIVTILLGGLSIFLLSHIYIDIISISYDNASSFGDYGNPTGSFDTIRYLISFSAFIPFAFFLKTSNQNIQSVDIVIYIYTMFAIIPAITMYTVGLNSSFLMLCLQLSMLLIFFYTLKFASKITTFRSLPPFFKINEQLYIRILILFFISASLFLYYKIGSTSQVSSITNVYAQRAAVAENHGFFIHILTSFLIYGLANFLIFWSLLNRSLYYLSILLLGILVIFISTGSKAMLVSPLLVFGGYTIFIKKIHITYILYFLTLSLLLIYFVLPNESAFTSLMARRLLIIHGQLFNLYFEFATENGLNLLYKYTKSFIDNDYNSSISFVIGKIYYGNSTHANSGMVSDAYANFGIYGVVLYSGLLGLFLKQIEKLNQKEIYPMIFPSSLALTDSSVLAVLVFQLFPLFLILMLWTPKKNDP